LEARHFANPQKFDTVESPKVPDWEALTYQHRETTQHDITAVRRHIAYARLRHIHRQYRE
jgi:hypothetical protein